MVSSSGSQRFFIGKDGTQQPDRRTALPTMELWKANMDALRQCGVNSCQMRYAVAEDNIAFVVQFSDRVPVGGLNFNFPVIEKANLKMLGWVKFNLTLEISEGGQLSVMLKGRFERDGVPLGVEVEFIRAHGTGLGVAHDFVAYTDRRTGDRAETSVAEVLDQRFKDGTPKFCRKGDSPRDLAVEGIVAILSRFFKDAAARRRVVR